MSCNDIDFVAFDLTRKHHFGHPCHDPLSQLDRHLLSTVLVQIQLVSNLSIRQIQPHEIQTQQPHAQRLMVPFEHGLGEIVELPATPAAMMSLPTPLRVIEAALGDLVRTTVRTLHPLRPAQPPNGLKTLFVINQRQKSEFHPWLTFTIISDNQHASLP